MAKVCLESPEVINSMLATSDSNKWAAVEHGGHDCCYSHLSVSPVVQAMEKDAASQDKYISILCDYLTMVVHINESIQVFHRSFLKIASVVD